MGFVEKDQVREQGHFLIYIYIYTQVQGILEGKEGKIEISRMDEKIGNHWLIIKLKLSDGVE